MSKTLVIVACVALLGMVFYQSETPISGKKIILGQGGYDIAPLDAPVATSTFLDVLSFVLTKSIFGPSLRRMLLNDNKIALVREISAQIDLPPLFWPMKRLKKSELASVDTEIAQQAELDSVLADGFNELINTDGSSRTIQDYANYYKSGHLPSDVMKNTIKTVKEWETQGFNIFSSISEGDILSQAYASDARHKAGQPLSVFDGVPIAFKDMMEVKGLAAYDGRNPHSDVFPIAERDDIIVTRLRKLGAIIFGLTIMVEGGVSPLGYNSHFKGPFNPYSLNRYSGGSSSGSAVVVACGLVPAAIGYDGGGSIRIPSTMSGIHGLATTFGRIPYDNHTDSTMIKAGPMVSSAQDAALMFAALANPDENDFYTQMYDGGVHGPPQPHITDFMSIEDLSDVRIGIFSEWFNDSTPAIRARCYEVVDYLTSKGATVVYITIPHLQLMSLSHGVKISTEFAMGWDSKFYAKPDALEPNTRIVVGLGSTVSALEALATDKLRHWSFEFISELYKKEKLTAIVNPTMGVEVPYLSEAAKLRGESNTALVVKVIKHIFMANYLGLPGYSVPVGFVPAEVTKEDQSETPLPVGFHLQGNHWGEAPLLRLAHSIEVGYTRVKHAVGVEKTARKPLFHYDPFAVTAASATAGKSGVQGRKNHGEEKKSEVLSAEL